MPRFYFDMSFGGGLEDSRDTEGQELEGLNAARIAAVTAAGEILRDFPDRFWSQGVWNCKVRDDTGASLFVLHFYAQDTSVADGPGERGG